MKPLHSEYIQGPGLEVGHVCTQENFDFNSKHKKLSKTVYPIGFGCQCHVKNF